MNILLQTGSWDFPKGGTDYFVKNLAGYLEKNGHKIVIVSNRFPYEKCKNHEEGNIKIFYFEPQKPEILSRPFEFFKNLFKKGKMIRKIVKENKIEVMMGGQAESLSLILGKMKARIIIRGGGLFYQTIKKRLLKENKNFLKKYLIIFMAKLYDEITLRFIEGFVPISNTEKIFFDRYGKNVKMIPHGADIGVFKPKKKVWGNRLVYVGGFVPVKNPEKLFELLSKIKQKFSFTWIGNPGANLSKKYFENLKRRYGIKAEILDDIKNRDIPDFLNKQDIFVSAELAEGIGLSTVEAAACGLPIVSLNAESASYPFFTKNEKEWVIEVSKLLKDKKYQIKVSKLTRDIVEKKYSRDKKFKDYENFMKFLKK